jgi:ribosomal protein S18 acetylase RimI-like enzyme
MTSIITVRELGVDDYDRICAVWEASGLTVRPTGRDSHENFVWQMSTGVQTVLGAQVDGVLAGIAVVTHDSRKGWINRLGVAQDYQRQGVGRALIHAAEDYLHSLGLMIVAALIEHDNDASLALFQAEGYQVGDVYYVTKRDRPDV